MPNLAIFDFDGTIADTLESAIKICNKVAPKYGLEKVKLSEKESLRNFGAKELIKKFKIPTLKIPFLLKEVQAELRKDIQNIPIIPGMAELFSELEKHNITIGIVTSNSVENVELFLQKYNITNVAFIHSESNIFGKAKVLNRVNKEQKSSKKRTVYIGDEVRDIEASKKAQIPMIAVTWGFNSEERLKQSKPDYIVSKPADILKKLETIS